MSVIGLLDVRPRVRLGHLPTPVEPMDNLARRLAGHGGAPRLLVKRDDCTGIGFGGNKVRQLEFYLGDALAAGADTVLITGAVQSNFVRTCAAMAARLGLACHAQLEERVPRNDPLYRGGGNVLLDRIAGATIHSYPEGEDEAGADRALEALADRLRAEGRRPYVIHLGTDHPPLGALGYVAMADELLGQLAATGTIVDRIFLASGSAATHTGTLWGLRALGSAIPVVGICVRRAAALQAARVRAGLDRISALLGHDPGFAADDVRVDDAVLAPGYGRLNAATREAIALAGATEGLFVDPVYSGRVLAALVAAVRDGSVAAGESVLFVHTGGQPALFAYGDDVLATG
ncbi:MAG: D-cysteine desulfhydrase family protein [Alphaproteobacteria bacterium]|nr:D-cysteine desulfhydrase family protein [Alphaproteobacteria bacterium]